MEYCWIVVDQSAGRKRKKGLTRAFTKKRNWTDFSFQPVGSKCKGIHCRCEWCWKESAAVCAGIWRECTARRLCDCRLLATSAKDLMTTGACVCADVLGQCTQVVVVVAVVVVPLALSGSAELCFHSNHFHYDRHHHSAPETAITAVPSQCQTPSHSRQTEAH